MPNSLTIPKNPVYPPSMDWSLLRREGIQHIERLGSAIWTDYNLHDPGITILEILCYALTDLGYRANLPAADLFAGGEGKPFFTAAEILSCGPVTALDLRKILIDIPGVRNAWVEQMSDPEVQFKLEPNNNSSEIKTTIENFLNSKYKNLLGLEEGSQIELNNIFPDFNEKEDNTGILYLLIEAGKCNDEKKKHEYQEKLKEKLIISVLGPVNDNDILKKSLLLYMAEYYLPEVAFFIEQDIINSPNSENEERIILQRLRILTPLIKIKSNNLEEFWDEGLEVNVDDRKLIKLIDSNVELKKFLYAQPLLCLILQNSLAFSALPEDFDKNIDYNLFIPQGIYTISLKLEEEAEVEANAIKAEARKRLHRYRNLGEDVDPDIRIIEKKKIGIKLSLELTPSVNELAVLAKVHEAVNNYLSPSLRFYSLEEMLNKYGSFLLNTSSIEQLEKILLPPEVLTAIRRILDKEYIGIDAFSKAIEQSITPEQYDEYYSLIFIHAQKKYEAHSVYQGPLLKHGFLDEGELLKAQPRQTIYKSDLYRIIAAIEGVKHIETLEMFHCKEVNEQNGKWCLQFECRCLPELNLECSQFTVSKGGIEIPIPSESIKDYLDTHPPLSTKIIREGNMDLPVPIGKGISDLTDYTSIQEDFPRTYKIGHVGIASKEPDLRKAQTKQLKGYLLFYDQIMANYLSHLENVRSLLSIEKHEKRLYQPLYSIPGIKELLLDFESEDWGTFTGDTENDYVQILRRLTEGNATEKNIRDNKILDHLLGRFGEEFSDYVLKLYQIERSVERRDLWEENSGLEDSLMDKQRFLDHLPKLGSHRAGGFNYHFTQGSETGFWNTDNVSGLKNRVCAKLGIEDWSRHTITCEPAFVVEVAPVRNLKGSKNKYEFYIKPEEGSPTRLLVSTTKFSTSNAAEKASADFLNMASDSSNYSIVEDEIGFWAGTADSDRKKVNALLLEPIINPDQVNDRLKYIQNLATAHCQDDSFHIIEHLLLRPRNNTFSNLLRPMVCCLDRLELLDPYSFWLSVVVPDWVARFKHPVHRQNFEQTVRAEAPAHLAIRFCVLDRNQMLSFEKGYYNWLKELCTDKQDNLANPTDNLIALMNSWEDAIIHY